MKHLFLVVSLIALTGWTFYPLFDGCFTPNILSSLISVSRATSSSSSSSSNIQLAVETLLASSNNNTNDNVYFLWDFMSPIVRFLLLNQTKIQNTSFDITKQLEISPNGLSWSELPLNVQTILSRQSDGDALLALTFSEWAWTEPNENNLTLKHSLQSSYHLNNIASTLNLLKPVRFDLRIDIKILYNKLRKSKHWWLKECSLNEFFNLIFEYFPAALVYVLEQRNSQERVALQAVYRAELFMSTVNTTNKGLRTLKMKTTNAGLITCASFFLHFFILFALLPLFNKFISK